MLAENLENLVKKERLEGMQAGRQEGMQLGRQTGRQEGKLEAQREIARNLIASTAMDDRAISEVSLLPIEEISRLRTEPRH